VKIVFLLRASITVINGGSELQADLIINELLKSNHKIFYISDMIRTPKRGRPNVKYIYLKDYGPQYSILNVISLIKILKDISPDIIYQRWRIPYTGLAAWYAKRHSKKLIFNIANDIDPRKNKIDFNQNLIPNLINEYIGRYGVKNADLIIAQTEYQRSILKKSFNRDCVIIPNGHPIPDPPFKKSFPPIVLWIGNIKPLKRLELFLDVVSSLQDTNAVFLFVGRFPNKKYQRNLYFRARNIKNVKYLGELSLKKTNALVSKASVLVNTSIREGFPNTFIQAWMRETPVVSLSIDPDNVMEKFKIGFCSKTFNQLVKDVRILVENKEKLRIIGKRARQYAIKNHDIKLIGEKYLNIFEKLENQS